MKEIALILVTALLAVSCSTVFMASNVRKLDVGMTKIQALHVMGKDYTVVYADARQTILAYTNPDPSSRERYFLTFENNVLVTIETLLEPLPPQYPAPHPHR